MSTEFQESRWQKREWILPGIAIVFSILAFAANSDLSNIAGFLVSLVGITAGVMYFMRKQFATTLLLIWIYAQLPAIARVTQAGELPLLDAGQFLTFKLGLTLSGTQLRLNLVPFAYLALYRFLLMAGLVGKRVVITSFRKESTFGEVLPIIGIIDRSFDLGGDKNWVLAELDRDVVYGDKSYQQALLKSKEGDPFKPGNKVISHLRLVADEHAQEKFPFVDWVFVQVLK